MQQPYSSESLGIPILSATPRISVQQTVSPQTAVSAWLQEPPAERLLIVDFNHADPGLEPRPLWLLVYQSSDAAPSFTVMVPNRTLLDSNLGAGASPGRVFQRLLTSAGAPDLSLGNPLRLQPVRIAKPWGQEIWYTGIEQRGVSGVGDGQRWLPLSWLLAALPGVYGAAPPVLLKILDPLADELFGDLYFELHEQKREVYVVTGIDADAWPDGVGAIRYGFDPDLLESYPDHERFRQDYLHAVADYRKVREEIDQWLDEYRASEAIAADAPVPAARLRVWLERLSPAMLERECRLRRAMERFTRLRPLRVGDVVRVPLRTPHALQHGVRTVEFQTPVYERLILSFGQKVLTQRSWDTQRAAQLMRLQTPPDEPSPTIRSGAGWCEQRIVDFPDFEARRLQFSTAAECVLPALVRGGVAMSVTGSVRVGGIDLQPEEAVLLPVAAAPLIAADPAACLLWAQPSGTAPPVE